MVRILVVFGLLALAACAGQSSDSSQSRPAQGLYGSFNGGANVP
jgi:hypothetical protein